MLVETTKKELNTCIFLMDNAACALEEVRSYTQESFNKEYWKSRVKFWEKELDRCIEDLKIKYNQYLKS